MGKLVKKKLEKGKLIEQIADELEAYFEQNPPKDVPDAVRKIKEQFGINITATPVRYWLKAKAIHTKSQKAYQQKPIAGKRVFSPPQLFPHTFSLRSPLSRSAETAHSR